MRASRLLDLYPGPWRDRYGAEIEALLEAEPLSAWLVFDLLRGAAVAHVTPLPGGGLAMHRSHAPALASLLAIVFVLPAAVFFGAAITRGLQPTRYQPAHAAQVVFDAFTALPGALGLVLLAGAPLIALVLSALAMWRRLADDPGARDDVRAFAAGLRRLGHQPALLGAALAFIASAGIVAVLLVHSIVG